MNGYDETAKNISEIISKEIGISKYKIKVGQRLEKIFKSENPTGKKIKYSYFYKKYMDYTEATASRYFDRYLKGEDSNLLEHPEILNALHSDEMIQAHIGYLLGFDLFICDTLEEYKKLREKFEDPDVFEAEKNKFLQEHPDCPKEKSIERLSLVMRKEFAQAIIDGKKTVEIRDGFSKKYQDMLYDKEFFFASESRLLLQLHQVLYTVIL